MRKIKIRLQQRYLQFKMHPLTKGRAVQAICRYIYFHVLIRFKKEKIYNWLGDLKFIARRGEAGIVGNIYYGLYEFEESIFLLHLLNENDLLLDIGANVGHYSLLVAGLKKTRCIAIEPVPKTYLQLEKQVELNNLNDLIETKNLGVSNTNGELFFSTDRGSMNRIVDQFYLHSVVVEVQTMDSLLADEVPLAIKIDVEGYEKHTLEGAKKTLENIDLKVIILELNESGQSYNVTNNDVYNTVLNYGFKPYSYFPKDRCLQELSFYNREQFNTIFVRDLDFVQKRICTSSSIKIGNNEF